jgi:hypothetical protein
MQLVIVCPFTYVDGYWIWTEPNNLPALTTASLGVQFLQTCFAPTTNQLCAVSAIVSTVSVYKVIDAVSAIEFLQSKKPL